MSIDLLSTIGSGARVGIAGRVLGTGVIIRDGGMFIAVGHTTGTGITFTHGIIAITGAHSVREDISITDIMSCIMV